MRPRPIGWAGGRLGMGHPAVGSDGCRRSDGRCRSRGDCPAIHAARGTPMTRPDRLPARLVLLLRCSRSAPAARGPRRRDLRDQAAAAAPADGRRRPPRAAARPPRPADPSGGINIGPAASALERPRQLPLPDRDGGPRGRADFIAGAAGRLDDHGGLGHLPARPGGRHRHDHRGRRQATGSMAIRIIGDMSYVNLAAATSGWPRQADDGQSADRVLQAGARCWARTPA